jgi:hypothetical protein
LIRQLDVIRRLVPRMPVSARHALLEQAEAIHEMGTGILAADRRDLNAAYDRARAVPL